MSNSMIEKVARVLHYTIILTLPWDKLNRTERETYMNAAKLAIAAMREPTEEMLEAARDWSYKKYGKPIGNDAATGCLQAMIDAALRE